MNNAREIPDEKMHNVGTLDGRMRRTLTEGGGGHGGRTVLKGYLFIPGTEDEVPRLWEDR